VTPTAPRPGLAILAGAEAHSEQWDSSEYSGSDAAPQAFRHIAEIVDALIRKLWRQQHGTKPCPLDRPHLIAIDGGRQ